MINKENFERIKKELQQTNTTLIAVSKTKPTAAIQALYDLGQRDFGENYVQELIEKQEQLPKDIHWHYIGHLQTNKVKYIASFVHLIHAVESFKLLQEINKQAEKNNRVIDVLLQMHIAQEETKYGMDNHELLTLLEYYEAQKNRLQHVRICGLMGMASFTENQNQLRNEFQQLKNFFEYLKRSNFLFQDYFNICSMGMSSDYTIAIEEGSTMVRIGSLLFGARNYN